MHKRGRFLPGLVLLLVVILLAGFAPAVQTAPTAISLSVSAGYDGRFRSERWMPIRVRVSNDGEDISGRLVVRPETSGSALTNSFSTPVELASGARQSVFLYITARNFANQLRIEFIDNFDNVIAAETALVRAILPQDQLYVVITQAASGSVDLTGATVGGYDAFQANWQIDNLPSQSATLEAVDMMLFSDVDTGGLSTAQRQTIEDWVTRGGHLVVTGGTNWQSTAAGLVDLLPITPENSETVDSLSGLSRLGGALTEAQNLSGQTVIATGSLSDDAEILASSEDDLPLLIRRRQGAGVVDYLAADPGAQPLRDWSAIKNMWFTLASSSAPKPSWANGFQNWERAGQASEILPGYNILPDVLPLCGFLVAYIALIGPINYVILNRINRREFAWVTIPVLIVVFSAMAWGIGFNLRGNRVTVSRLAVVQSWPDSERAQLDGIIGLLSPRRSTYTLTATNGDFLRPVPRSPQTGGLFNSAQAITDIQQTGTFSARDFPVDASFIASFNTSGAIEKPAISGQAALVFEGSQGQQVLSGTVRNDSDITLLNPVILARGVAFSLGEALEPGDLEDFQIALTGEGPAASSPMQHVVSNPGSLLGTSAIYLDTRTTEQSVIDIMGEVYDPSLYYGAYTEDETAQENRRRQLFLSSFNLEPYAFSGRSNTGRGNRVYMAGWSEETSPLALDLIGANWDARDTTLYLIELEIDYRPPTNTVLVSTDQFTWTVQERLGMGEVVPGDISLQPGDDVVFRFTPLPDVVLKDVSELTLRIERPNSARIAIPLKLWNWTAGEWTDIEVLSSNDTSVVNTFPISNPQRFLGPLNAVLIRLVADETGGYLNIDSLAVEQRGRF